MQQAATLDPRGSMLDNDCATKLTLARAREVWVWVPDFPLVQVLASSLAPAESTMNAVVTCVGAALSATTSRLPRLESHVMPQAPLLGSKELPGPQNVP